MDRRAFLQKGGVAAAATAGATALLKPSADADAQGSVAEAVKSVVAEKATGFRPGAIQRRVAHREPGSLPRGHRTLPLLVLRENPVSPP